MRLRRNFAVNFLLVLLFTTLGLAVMGYHPGIEDDGLYLSAVKSNVNPALYPHDADFFRLQLQATFFDKWVAGFVHLTGLSVATSELLWQFGCILLTVFACWSIARKLFPEDRAQWAGVAFVVAMFTLPVAGTALYMADQHLHPRNVATAIVLLAISRILAGKRWQAVPLLVLAFFTHPIMAAMGISFCFFLILVLTESAYVRLAAWLRFGRAAGGSAVAAVLVPLGWIFEPPSPVWKKALDTRTYYYLYKWEWYEWLGALAPLLLFLSLIHI